MVYLNEWFPNPFGADAAGEFMELYNPGSATVSLDGWTLETEKGKKISLAGRTIPPHGYLVLKHADTKSTLRNSDGGLALYNAAGALVDHGNFAGPAPKGKSFSRVDYGTADIAHFAFVNPTPGAANQTANNTITVRAYPTGVTLNNAVGHLNASGFFVIMVGSAALIAGLAIYIAKSHEDLSHLFFGRDEEARGGVREPDKDERF